MKFLYFVEERSILTPQLHCVRDQLALRKLIALQRGRKIPEVPGEFFGFLLILRFDKIHRPQACWLGLDAYLAYQSSGYFAASH